MTTHHSLRAAKASARRKAVAAGHDLCRFLPTVSGPRAVCSRCGRVVVVRQDGAIRWVAPDLPACARWAA